MRNLGIAGQYSAFGQSDVNNIRNSRTKPSGLAVCIEKSEENPGAVTIYSTDGREISYLYAVTQKAMMKARRYESSEIMPDKQDDFKRTNEALSEKADLRDVPEIKSANVFDFIPESLQKEFDEQVRPNTLVDANLELRENTPENLSELDKRLIKAVDNAFKQIEGLKQDTTFYRALRGKYLDKDILNAQEGDIIIPDRGYSQIGLSMKFISRYIPDEKLNPVIFKMNCKKGSKVCLVPANLTGSRYEEAMLPRSAVFKVAEKRQSGYEYIFQTQYGTLEKRTMPVLEYVLEYMD